MAFGAEVLGEEDNAADNSLKKTMTIDDEFVVNSIKVSAGLLRERWEDRERMKFVRTFRQACGNAISSGMTGEYQ